MSQSQSCLLSTDNNDKKDCVRLLIACTLQCWCGCAPLLLFVGVPRRKEETQERNVFVPSPFGGVNTSPRSKIKGKVTDILNFDFSTTSHGINLFLKLWLSLWSWHPSLSICYCPCKDWPVTTLLRFFCCMANLCDVLTLQSEQVEASAKWQWSWPFRSNRCSRWKREKQEDSLNHAPPPFHEKERSAAVTHQITFPSICHMSFRSRSCSLSHMFFRCCSLRLHTCPEVILPASFFPDAKKHFIFHWCWTTREERHCLKRIQQWGPTEQCESLTVRRTTQKPCDAHCYRDFGLWQEHAPHVRCEGWWQGKLINESCKMRKTQLIIGDLIMLVMHRKPKRWLPMILVLPFLVASPTWWLELKCLLSNGTKISQMKIT